MIPVTAGKGAQPRWQQNISFGVQDLFNEVKPRAGQKEKVLIFVLVSSLGTDIPVHGIPLGMLCHQSRLLRLFQTSSSTSKRWKTNLHILTRVIIRKEAQFSGFSMFRSIKKMILKPGEDGWLHPCMSQVSARPCSSLRPHKTFREKEKSQELKQENGINFPS